MTFTLTFTPSTSDPTPPSSTPSSSISTISAIATSADDDTDEDCVEARALDDEERNMKMSGWMRMRFDPKWEILHLGQLILFVDRLLWMLLRGFYVIISLLQSGLMRQSGPPTKRAVIDPS